MKQQSPVQHRTRDRKSEAFDLNMDEYRHVGKKTGMHFYKKPDRDRGSVIGRWSDFTCLQEESIHQIPQVSSLDFKSIQRESQQKSKINEKSKLPNMSNTSNYPQEQKVSPQKQQQSQGMHQYQQQEQQQLVLSIPKNALSINEERSPFAVNGISDIKHRKSGGVRQSQQFLLELLKSQRGKRQQQKSKLSKQKQEQKNKRDKIIQNKIKMDIVEPSHPEKSKNKEISTIKREEKIDIISQTKEQPQQPNEKNKRKSGQSKRVTINDRGKIKLPSDSISSDFEYILPPSLRKYSETQDQQPVILQNPKRQKPQVPFEEEIQQNRKNEPMDIIEVPEASEIQENQQFEQKKLSLKQQKLQKKIRVVDNPDKLLQNRQKKKSDLRRNNIKDINDKKSKSKKTNISKKIEHSRSEKEQKKKIRKIESEQIIVHENVKHEFDQNRSRPQRNRKKPGNFWMGERNIYNKRGSIVAREGYTQEQFLQMIGYTNPSSIKSLFVERTLNKIWIEITLKPNQRIFSDGLNYQKMSQYFPDPDEFDQLLISPKNKHFKSRTEIKVDDHPEQFLNAEGIALNPKLTYELTNTSDSRSVALLLKIHNSSKSKQ